MKRNSGFTLVEVLVATLILFATIAAVTMIYRGSFIASQKAEHHVKINAVLPAVLTDIRQYLRSNGNVPRDTWSHSARAWDVDYLWQATLLRHASAPERFDIDTAQFVTPPARYKLWQVNLVLNYKGIEKQYVFKELSWNNE